MTMRIKRFSLKIVCVACIWILVKILINHYEFKLPRQTIEYPQQIRQPATSTEREEFDMVDYMYNQWLPMNTAVMN